MSSLYWTSPQNPSDAFNWTQQDWCFQFCMKISHMSNLVSKCKKRHWPKLINWKTASEMTMPIKFYIFSSKTCLWVQSFRTHFSCSASTQLSRSYLYESILLVYHVYRAILWPCMVWWDKQYSHNNTLRPSDEVICITEETITGSDNGLLPGWCQAIIKVNGDLLLTLKRLSHFLQ